MNDRVFEASAKLNEAIENFVNAKRGVDIESSGDFPLTVSDYLLLVEYQSLDQEGVSVSGTVVHPMGSRRMMLGLMSEADKRFTLDIIEDYSS